MLGKEFLVTQSLLEELDFVKAYSNQQERQISDYVANIDKVVKTAEVKKHGISETGEYHPYTGEVKYIEGFSEDDWDFKGIFTEEMPHYLRQAMFVSLWARFEYKLRDIAEMCAERESKELESKPKNKSYFLYLIEQLKKLKVDFDDSVDLCINTIDNEIRHVRNTWVHNGGVVTKKKVKRIVEKNKHLSLKGSVICINHEYILWVIDTMRELSWYLCRKISRIAANRVTGGF